MNGKDIVVAAAGKIRELLGSIGSAGMLEGDDVMAGVETAVALLESLQNRPTLRTKNGTSLAIPVQEACTALDEAWEDAEGGDDVEDLREKLEEMAAAINTFNERMKQRTIIMT